MRYSFGCAGLSAWCVSDTMVARKMSLTRVILVAFACLAAAESKPPAGRTASEPSTPRAADVAGKQRRLPHLRVDRKKKLVDIDATVALREGDWIELLACLRGSREHESILTVSARPSHIHLALLMLGAESGSPMMWRLEGEEIKIRPPSGAKVAVSIVTEKDGKTIETKANEWIVNQKTKQIMSDNIWLFTGSGFAEWDGKQVYRADAGGSVISLVNFGDDMLARPTRLTSHDDDALWGARTKAIPPIGTAVTVRLRPLPKAAKPKPGKAPPADAGPKPKDTR